MREIKQYQVVKYNAERCSFGDMIGIKLRVLLRGIKL